MTSGLRWVMAGSLVAGTVGCANPGQPKPPSLRLPQVVADLSAERVGGSVRLRWTTPATTTDNLPVTASMSAVICRRSVATGLAVGARAEGCVEIRRMPVRPGAAEVEDLMAGPLGTGDAGLMAYRVTILNAAGRSAGQTEEVFAVRGASLDPVEGLRATAIRRGVRMEWTAAGGGAVVELDRREVSGGAGASAGAAVTPRAPGVAGVPGQGTRARGIRGQGTRGQGKRGQGAPGQGAGGKRAKDQGGGSSKLPAEVHLVAVHPGAGGGVDAGGLIDGTAQKRTTYRYTAERRRSLTMEGHTLTERSAASAAVTVEMPGTIPPEAPEGLEAAAGGGDAAAIDLSWRPGAEIDLAGYRVYRKPAGLAVDGGQWMALTKELVAVPGFEDTTVEAGREYVYRVTAVDTDGNESAAGNEVRERAGSR